MSEGEISRIVRGGVRHFGMSEIALRVYNYLSEWSLTRGLKVVALFFGFVSAVLLIVVTWLVIAGDHTSAGLEGGGPSLLDRIVAVGLLAVPVFLGLVGVEFVRSGRPLWGATVVMTMVVSVLLFSGAEFAFAASRHCEVKVGFRTGVAQSSWVAADVVPVLEIDDTLGWQEPLPASIYTGGPCSAQCLLVKAGSKVSAATPAGVDPDPPFSSWGSVLAVKAVIVLVLLGGLKAFLNPRHPQAGETGAPSKDSSEAVESGDAKPA